MTDWTGNKASVWKTLGASNHTDKERENLDYYATDPIAIDKLMTKLSPKRNEVWECACGEGHLSERLKQYYFNVTSTDLIDRGYTDQNVTVDFLSISKDEFYPYHGYCDIITNPPYKYAKEFVLKALDLVQNGHYVCMFLKLTFLEGQARYNELFSKYPPAKIYVFSQRVLCAKNADFDGMKAGGGSAVAYAWYVWEKGYRGATEVEWI